MLVASNVSFEDAQLSSFSLKGSHRFHPMSWTCLTPLKVDEHPLSKDAAFGLWCVALGLWNFGAVGFQG